MKKLLTLSAVSLVALWVLTPAIAEAGTVGILTKADGSPGTPIDFVGIDPNYKTPRLVTSQTITLFIGGHITTTMTNFMGALWTVHMGDPSEVTFAATGSLTGPPLGSATATLPGSSPVFQSAVAFGSQFISPGLVGTPVPPSGITLSPSDAAPLAFLIVHPKDTTPLSNNSDIDLTVTGWGIFHLPYNATGSTNWQLPASAWIYATSNWTPNMSVLPPTPPEIGQGRWVHLMTAKTFHLNPGSSLFYATLLGTGFIGIEHVPEPMTGGLMLAGGCVALAASRVVRRRRVRMS